MVELVVELVKDGDCTWFFFVWCIRIDDTIWAQGQLTSERFAVVAME